MVGRELLDEVTYLDNLVGVQSVRRLVEDNELRAVDDGLRDAGALLVASGEVLQQTAAEVEDAATVHRPLDGGRDGCLVHQTQGGAVGQVFLHGHVGIQGRTLGEEADVLLGFHRILTQADAVDVDIAFGLVEYSADDVHRGGLPRSVGAEQAEDTAASHFQVYVAYRPVHAVTVGQVLYFYNCFFHNGSI